MRLNIVRIGNSRGIRIPKAVLSQCEITDAADLKVEGKRIILSPVRPNPRLGWDSAAVRMHQAGDDELLMPDVFEDDFEVDW